MKNTLILFLTILLFSTLVHTQSAGDLIISEYMADPSNLSDTEGEYFEIYNNTGSAININGWNIKDDGTNFHTITN